MGTWIGHVAPGVGFLLIGLWHLFNHIKLHCLRPASYTSPAWFPAPFGCLRYLEPALIMAGSCLSIALELFIGPEKHQPLDVDGAIPSNHLHNFEHASISLTFLIYAAFAVAFDRLRAPAGYALTQLLGAAAFGQQLLLFHLHSTDHMGVEGQYHSLLQIVIFVSLSTTLMGIASPQSFVLGFVRSASIAFQGVWFIIMGYALWTPGFIAKGCFMNLEDGHRVVRCHNDEALHRAKSLVNIQFSWCAAVFVVFVMLVYTVMLRSYPKSSEYVSLAREAMLSLEEEDLEGQGKLEESRRFIHMGKGLRSIELER